MTFLARQLRQRVTLERVASLTSSGDRTYSAPAVYSARVEERAAIIRDLDGEEVLATHRIAIITHLSIHDRIILEDGTIVYVRTTRAAQTLQGDASYTICEAG